MHHYYTIGAADVQTDWSDADQLADLGIDPAIIARLSIVSTGHDRRPCWSDEEILDLLGMIEREARS